MLYATTDDALRIPRFGIGAEPVARLAAKVAGAIDWHASVHERLPGRMASLLFAEDGVIEPCVTRAQGLHGLPLGRGGVCRRQGPGLLATLVRRRRARPDGSDRRVRAPSRRADLPTGPGTIRYVHRVRIGSWPSSNSGLGVTAPLLADVDADDAVVALFRVLALQFPLSALGKGHEHRLRRSLQFRRLFWPELVGGLAKGAVTIATRCASRACGLVIDQLVGTCRVDRAVDPTIRARGGRRRQWRPVRPAWAPGVEARSKRFPSFDYVVIGATLGAAALERYYLAVRRRER